MLILQFPFCDLFFDIFSLSYFLDNFIDIKYEHSVYPIRIHIYETYNPGGVTAIWAGIPLSNPDSYLRNLQSWWS